MYKELTKQPISRFIRQKIKEGVTEQTQLQDLALEYWEKITPVIYDQMLDTFIETFHEIENAPEPQAF